MTTQTAVKFLKKGIRDSCGNYFPCWYSLQTLIGRTEPTITIYAKSYSKGLPAELRPENNSDMQTDYFEKDKIRFHAGTPEFETLKGFAQ